MAILSIKTDTKRLRYVPRRSSCLSLQGLRVEGTASISSGVSLIVGTRRNGKLACNEPRALLRRGAFHVWIALRAAFGDATALLLRGNHDDGVIIIRRFCPVLIPRSAGYTDSHYPSWPGFIDKWDFFAVEYCSFIAS